MGILFALIALVCWGFGDFLIQRSTRRFGDWVALFYITAIAAVTLLPLVYRDVLSLTLGDFWLLLGTSMVIFFAAIFDFEALRRGKISVVAPIFALEVPITVGLAALIIGEHLMPLQYLLIFALLVGIVLVGIKQFHHLKNIHLERGVWLAVIATIGMGTVNFLFGVGARETSPLLINWFTSLFIAVATLIYLCLSGGVGKIATDWHGNKRLILTVGVIDNLAWVAYSFATLYIPIAIAIGISESYIALACLLGLLINKEKLKTHQWAGMILAVIAVIALAIVTGG